MQDEGRAQGARSDRAGLRCGDRRRRLQLDLSSRTPTTRFALPTISCRLPKKIATGGRATSPTASPTRSCALAICCYKISESTWRCGDPGMQYDTTINRWHTSKNTARINASNPCSEYMFLDDTACNLASLNLMKYLEPNGKFDVDAFRHACRRHDHGAGDFGR